MIPDTAELDIANCCDDLARTWVERGDPLLTTMTMTAYIDRCAAEFRAQLHLAIRDQWRRQAKAATTQRGTR